MAFPLDSYAQIAWGLVVVFRDDKNNYHNRYYSHGALDGFKDVLISVTYSRPPLALVGGTTALGGQATAVLTNVDNDFESLERLNPISCALRFYWYEGNKWHYKVKFRGDITHKQASQRTMTLQMRDSVFTLFKTWPVKTIQLEDFPLAPLDVIGSPEPIHFGQLSLPPDSPKTLLAPTVPLSSREVIGLHHLGQKNSFGGRIWSLINNKYFAEVIGDQLGTFSENKQENGLSFLEVLSGKRKIISTISFPLDDNMESDYHFLADFNQKTGIKNNSLLKVSLQPLPNLGIPTKMSIFILKNFYTPEGFELVAELWDNRQNILIGNFEKDYLMNRHDVQRWSLELDEFQRVFDRLADYSITLKPVNQGNLTQIRVETEFTINEKETTVFAALTGIGESAVEQQYEILTDPDMIGMKASLFNTSAINEAIKKRKRWRHAFSVMELQDRSQKLLDMAARETGVWWHYDDDSLVTCTPQDKNMIPKRAFTSDHIFGDITVEVTPNQQLANYVNMLYAYNMATREYQSNRAVGAIIRQQGHSYILNPTSQGGQVFSVTPSLLIDDSKTYYIYLENDIMLETVSGTLINNSVYVRPYSQSTLPYGSSNGRWWLGDFLDLRAMRSYVRLGESLQSLGGEVVKVSDGSDVGSYKSHFITDDETAELFINHLADWHFVPKRIVRFIAGVRASDLQQGDCIVLEHPTLPSYPSIGYNMRPLSDRATDSNVYVFGNTGNQRTGESTLPTATLNPQKNGNGDWVILEGRETTGASREERKEVVRVLRRAGDALILERGTLNTERKKFPPGATIRKVDTLYYIASIDLAGMDTWRITAVEIPRPI